MQIATKDDWPELHTMPAMQAILKLNASFDAKEMQNLMLGYVPSDQIEKWFLYFENHTLHIHRSWTGFKIFEVAFKSVGDQTIAWQAIVNQDPEQYSATLAEAEETLLELLHSYSTDEAHKPYESTFFAAIEEAVKPNYLGSPSVVMELVAPYFWKIICHQLAFHFSELEVIPEFQKTEYHDVLKSNLHVTNVMCGNDSDFHGLESWRTEQGLGKAIIKYFDLDSDYYSDENVFCIVTEGLAGVSLCINKIISDWAKTEQAKDLNELLNFIAVAREFVVTVLMGTNMVYFANVVLGDFTWENHSNFVRLDVDEEAEIQRDRNERILPGPTTHPRLDEHGKTVNLDDPSTPTGLWTWQDANSLAIIIPDRIMPAELAGIAFRTWEDVPQNNIGWEQYAKQSLIDEPEFKLPKGKKGAAGVVVLEEDGRVWAIAPSNAFGGYQATFPKGTCDPGMSLQATAIREAFEEAGLQVRLTRFLIDVPRSTSYTRYYLARRTGGDPADMGWESQAVLLMPADELPKQLTHKNDLPILQALSACLHKE